MRAIVLTVSMMLSLAVTLASCSTSGPANVSGVGSVIGQSLAGAQGKTPADQRRIDTTMARGCGGGVYTAENCDRHTKASAQRYAEFNAGDL